MYCASVPYFLNLQTHANHAYEYVSNNFDPSDYNTIAAIGGDGIIYEIINGLASRGDGENILKMIPIAPIPAGSGNGLIKSILFESHLNYSVTNATFLSIRGKKKLLDLSKYECTMPYPPLSTSPTVHLRGAENGVEDSVSVHNSFLQFSYGLVSDVDINTEFLRCLGKQLKI